MKLTTKLSLNKESLRTMTEAQSDEVQGGYLVTQYCSNLCSNRRTCLTRIVDCETSPYIYC